MSIISSAATGATVLIGSSVIGRAITFISNVIVARTVGRAALGIGALRLDEVMYLGPLQLVREGLRKVSYRGKTANEKQTLVNLAWISMPIGIIIALCIAFLLLQNPPKSVNVEDDIDPNVYLRSIAYTFIAVVIAFLHEPMFLLASSDMKQGLRARIQVAAQFGKSFVLIMLLVLFVNQNWGIEAFALANIGYALTLFLGYFIHYYNETIDISLLPKQLSSVESSSSSSRGMWYEKYFDTSISTTIIVFWMQAIQKWLLENGEKLILVFLGTSQDAGEYMLVAGLGSIVARILFQPIEEMSLAAFSKLEKNEDKQNNRKNAGKEQQLQQSKSSIYNLIRTLTLSMSLGGLMFTAFGPAFSHLLLNILYGSKWSSTNAPFLLGVYCLYILTMALNGVLEAFVLGVGKSEQLKQYNYWMFAFSIAFLSSVFILIPYGIVGLIMANIVKMICRIFVCLVFYLKPYMMENNITITNVDGTTRNFQLNDLFPKLPVFIVFAISFVMTQISSKFIYQNEIRIISFNSIGHLVIGMLFFLFTSFVCWKYHGVELKAAFVAGRKKKKE